MSTQALTRPFVSSISTTQLTTIQVRRQLPITSKITTLPYRYGSVEAKVFDVVVVAQRLRPQEMNRLEFAQALRCFATRSLAIPARRRRARAQNMGDPLNSVAHKRSALISGDGTRRGLRPCSAPSVRCATGAELREQRKPCVALASLTTAFVLMPCVVPAPR